MKNVYRRQVLKKPIALVLHWQAASNLNPFNARPNPSPEVALRKLAA